MSHNRADDDQKGYTWEAGYAEGLNIREVLEEDEGGSIEKAIGRLLADARRRQRATEKPARVRLGIMRYVFVILDCSRSMAKTTWLPSTLQVALKGLAAFLEKFFEQNPIAQVGIILCKDRKAERFMPLTGNLGHILESLRGITEAGCAGDFSLQNGLQLTLTNLQELPGHVSREVIVLTSAFATVDPGYIFSTIDALKTASVRCSVVGMSAEVFVYKQLAKLTLGRYDVAMDEEHLRLLLAAHTAPPPTSKSVECNAVRIGFPPHESVGMPSFCQCHPDSAPLSERGFLCVQCGSRYCSLPVECRVCRLTLVAAPQLARAFRHLLPLPPFEAIASQTNVHAVKVNDEGERRECSACCCLLEVRGVEVQKETVIVPGSTFACKECRSLFCFDCDILLHESLNICPGCA